MKIPRSLPADFVLLAIILPGCGPKPAGDAPAFPQAQATQEVSKGEIFATPAPQGAAHDPRVAEAASAGDAVAHALAVIHQRLQDLEKAYDTKARTEGDLAAVTERMKPLHSAARADCDAILRASRDLRTQLPYAQAGYASAAASYRARAEGYPDPDLREVTMKVAHRYQREAADIPRRLALTDAFIKHLEEAQGFLSDTERCLRDTATALTVFSAGRHEPGVSAEGRVFRKRLEQFIAVVAEYHKNLLPQSPPAGATQPAPLAEPAKEKSPAEAGPGSTAKATPPPPGAERRDSSDTSGGTAVAIPAATTTAKRTWSRDMSPERPSANAMIASGRGRPYNPAAAFDPLRTGTDLVGELSTPSRGFRSPVTLSILGRAGAGFTGVMTYGKDQTAGRRGVRGRVRSDGHRITMWAEWHDGNVSPEAIRYDLTEDGGSLAGTWETPILKGTIQLNPCPF